MVPLSSHSSPLSPHWDGPVGGGSRGISLDFIGLAPHPRPRCGSRVERCCSAGFGSSVHHKKPLCARGFAELCQKGGGHFFIRPHFPTCFIGWEMLLKNKRQFLTYFLCSFLKECLNMEIWFLRPIDLLFCSRSNSSAGQLCRCSLPQTGPPVNWCFTQTRLSWSLFVLWNIF